MELRVLPGVFAVCRLPPDAPSPERFWSLSRTDDELSVICMFVREERLARAVAPLEAAGRRVGTDS